MKCGDVQTLSFRLTHSVYADIRLAEQVLTQEKEGFTEVQGQDGQIASFALKVLCVAFRAPMTGILAAKVACISADRAAGSTGPAET